jgi:hypothetical protein
VPHIAELQEKWAYDRATIFIGDGHSAHAKHPVIALGRENHIDSTRTILFTPRTAKSICAFSDQDDVSKKNQSKGMKRKARKIYRALLTFYKSIFI